MQALPSDIPGLSASELERIAAALGPAVHTPYAPPHVYPMSAPAFTPSPQAERQRPPGDRLGLYIHVPFCNYSCNFCFYVRRIGDGRPEMERYVQALRRELQWVAPGSRLTQLYVGGGTPTALPAHLLDSVLADVFERMKPEGTAIHTVESSPESVTREHLEVLTSRGIGRVSMGIQTLNADVLQRVNRQHSGAEALAACERLLDSGLLVNIDLIYGLPGQSEEMFAHDFETLDRCGIDSVTVYNLRVNERTSVVHDLAPGEHLSLARLVQWRAFVLHTAARLGFTQKSWHAFERRVVSRPGHEDHTSTGDQFGIGASARSRLGHTIYRNHSSTPTYLERVERGLSPVEDHFPLGEQDRKLRFITTSLGVGKPLRRQGYEQAFGTAFDDDFGEPLRRLGQANLVADDGESVQLSATGRLVWDLATLAFYPQRIRDWLGQRQAAVVDRRAKEPGSLSAVALPLSSAPSAPE
jgi:oxygen-independent coproporphyrinogen-3 oxidase